ncbi:MAG: acyl-ACP--UDP-N-acetylglucosamine O-acyltransferase [Rubrivivax sp.]|uniref:acyl-ACP--UDP-N-acetylglucosamine O-acyltransferase n=1 Tax=Ottowia sp. TaxID=1898956 RepID=UPI0011D62312|nr:acyl-ACP--UDP-N-acetylglucosamine O-acyltransferase [Ottowia sp.]MCC6813202.1 acyl-ACP--UDP-N-acetylglucosamine O-acyltransferase [Rubrivivax sp.]MCZ2089193.1 acyl-ACP--UDP-N-acetylglucosamine O-acyltransferase [Burkholderiales bacterium]TXI15306.1 MAG: acyl-ACP--UDP-N-acetylglucosamine O-acyltransferase [Ottowia sp.]HNE60062.1 acyl-ACP--UDP-N-acetylglucosamine O-acyltransferase [Ottowia sp.]HNI85162.1 acyl-ACP--UDP-N-acetylglucosamine O-acyltransferase [Ottowia sp.]
MPQIHPTALVDPRAELDPTVEVGPYAVIGPQVRIGAGSKVGAHCVVDGHTTIGRDNRFFPFASIGAAPQDKKYAGEPTRLEIGDGNTIREYVTINTGTVQDAGVTRLGDDNWIMAYVHIAHDCRLGSHLILANAVQLAGHVHLGDWVFLGGLTGVHQFVRVGDHAMTAFQTRLAQDVPPFVTAGGNPAEAQSINAEGLRRRGFSAERITLVKQMYRLLYRKGLTLEAARQQIDALRGELAEADADIALMQDFLRTATRGIVR